MKVLVIDNYDSFVYNLVHYLEAEGAEVTVIRNDEDLLSGYEIYDKILLSPGPGLPNRAGKMPELIQLAAGKKSILGVCLGHQALGEYFGMQLGNLATVHHGVASRIKVHKKGVLFKELPDELQVGRYHSWVVDKEIIPDFIEILATDDQGEIMAFQHRELPVYGVQFHPESVLTEHGKEMIRNWLNS